MLKKKNLKRCISLVLCLTSMVVFLNIPTTNIDAADTPVVDGVRSFQNFINTNLPSQYLGTPLVVDGICGPLTESASVKLIQYYINTIYGEGLTIDGHFGPASQIAFHRYKGTIEYGEVGIWVYILQGLLYCHGYNPNGFDGSYGSGGGTGCLNAVNAYKANNYIYEHQGTSGTVGVETISSLCWKSSYAQKTFYIRNKANGKYLYASSTNQSVGLHNSYNSSAFQKWQFQFIENGEFRLVNMGDSAPTTGDYVYALNASSSSTVTVQPGNTSLSTQRWKIDGRIDNFRLVSKAYTLKALRATSTTSVGLADLTSTNTRWELIEANNPYSIPFIESDLTVDKFDKTDLMVRMNCYSYALGYFGVYEEWENPDSGYYRQLMLAEHLQPGNISGYSTSAFSEIPESCKIQIGNKIVINNTGTEIWKNAILERVDADLNALHLESSSIQRIYTSSLGERIVGPWKKVALVLDNESSIDELSYDYHWYIQHEDGKWSHKRGLSDAYVVDSSGNTIYNPQTCNRNYGEINYSYFAGFYKIRIDSVYNDGFRHQGSYYHRWDNAGDVASMSRSLGTVSATSPYEVKGSIEYYYVGKNPTSANDQTAFVNRYSWEGDVDWYEFMVSEAGTYLIETQGSTDTFGALYQGTTLLYKHDDIKYPTNNNFRMQVTLSPNVIYTLRVSGTNNLISGDYLLLIEKT